MYVIIQYIFIFVKGVEIQIEGQKCVILPPRKTASSLAELGSKIIFRGEVYLLQKDAFQMI